MTEQEIKKVWKLRSIGLSWRNISLRLGIGEHLIRYNLFPEHRAAARQKRKERWQNVERHSSHNIVKKHNVVPDHVIAERSRIEQCELTLAQVIFGDPKSGRSALDKKLSI